MNYKFMKKENLLGNSDKMVQEKWGKTVGHPSSCLGEKEQKLRVSLFYWW